MPRDIVDRDASSRDWFGTQVATWLDRMHEKGSPMIRPMLLFHDSKGKSFSVVVTMENGYFHDFVKNVPGILENGKNSKEPIVDVVYYFHTNYMGRNEPDDTCKERSRAHFIGFSSKEDGVLDHAHAEVCVKREPGKDGKDVVTTSVLQPSATVKFHESMKPLFDNPFFTISRKPGNDLPVSHVEFVKQ